MSGRSGAGRWKRSAREAAKARAVAERRAHYERWESARDEQLAQWERANSLRAYLTAIEAKGQAGARDYLAWAKGLVDQLDPATTVMVPAGDVPDWPHEERFRLGRPQTHAGLNYRGW